MALLNTIEIDEGILLLTITRPERRNALELEHARRTAPRGRPHRR